MVVVACTPAAELSPLAADPVLCTLFDAPVCDWEAVLPPLPAPPAASTVPVEALALLLPVCPVPDAAPLVLCAFPVLFKRVTFAMVTFAALLAPAPIEPPVAMLPLLLLVTVTEAVAPVVETLPLAPLPVLAVEFEAFVLDAAPVEPLPEPEPA
jgi:hypothetical protein